MASSPLSFFVPLVPYADTMSLVCLVHRRSFHKLFEIKINGVTALKGCITDNPDYRMILVHT